MEEDLAICQSYSLISMRLTNELRAAAAVSLALTVR
jgi:hypothetical protein